MESVAGKNVKNPVTAYLSFFVGIDLSSKYLHALVITCLTSTIPRYAKEFPTFVILL